MDNPKFEAKIAEYPIAIQISIGKDRRIRLPKFLSVPFPYVLVENKQADQYWLAIYGTNSLSTPTLECNSLRILAEYRTCRPTLPKAMFDKHGMSEKMTIWLVCTKKWIEIVPESAWQADSPEFS